MTPTGNNPRRPTPTPVAAVLLTVAGALALLVCVLAWGSGPNQREATLVAGLFVFAGLCWVAAAIAYAATTLRGDD
jgi:cation transporter-like permease